MSQTSGSATIYFNTKGEKSSKHFTEQSAALGYHWHPVDTCQHTWPHSTKHLGKAEAEIKQSRTILLLPPYISLPSNKVLNERK